MQKRNGICTVVVGIAMALCMCGVGLASDETKIVSPDGNAQCIILLQEARLKYAVTFGNKPVIETSPMGIAVDGVDLAEGVEAGKVDRYELKETYPWRGVHSQAVNHCNGATISLRHARSRSGYRVEVRAFNDGVGFRYVVPGNRKPRVPEESTVFVVPDGSTVWYQDLEGHYEGVHDKNPVADIRAGQWVAPPMTFKLPDDAGYASITEAALVNYSGMALQCDGNRGFQLVFGHKHHVSYPFRLRYKNDIERVSKPAAITAPGMKPSFCRHLRLARLPFSRGGAAIRGFWPC